MAKCKDCIHREACMKFNKVRVEVLEKTASRGADELCDTFADKSRYIKLPCKVGDTVYVLTSDSPTGIEESRVKTMLLQEMPYGTTIKIIVPCIYDDWGGDYNTFYPNYFGKTVFLTKEEAEAAIAERSKE